MQFLVADALLVHLVQYPICPCGHLLGRQLLLLFRIFNGESRLSGFQHGFYIRFQLGFVLLGAAFPYKGVLVCDRFDFRPVDILDLE